MKNLIARNVEGENVDSARLLWSGGWDSSFRLLQLLLVRRRRVQPYYIIDPDRLSTGAEIRAIKNIKARLFREHPETHELLLPTKFREVNDIAADHEITEALMKIRERCWLGAQYDWLARFAREFGPAGMELCIETWHSGGPYKLLAPSIRAMNIEGEPTYVLGDHMRGTPEYVLFSHFTFPIFHVTKREMQRVSDEVGFRDLMELTWFCYSPRSSGEPCGTCHPCISAIEEGMGRRLPLSSHIRYRLYSSFLEKHPALGRLLRRRNVHQPRDTR